MALTRLFKENGYGQLELNQVAFRRDGRIEAQCALDSAFSASVPAENGMILAVDNIARKIKFPGEGTDLVALNYTTEHMYDERKNALKDFCLTPEDGFYPRLGYLATGDKFTTNCVCYDASDASDAWAASDADAISALEAYATTPVYGKECSAGAILLSGAVDPSALVNLKVIKYTTMPDGTPGIKFQVL